MEKREDGALEWKRYDPVDLSCLKDPDAGLLVQDYAGKTLSLPGYTE